MPKRKCEYCSVRGCKNNKTHRNLSFFTLPTDEERRTKWLKIIGRTDLIEKLDLKPKSYFVCSAHFESDLILQKPYLKPEALPTKYIPDIPGDETDDTLNQRDAATMDVSTQTKNLPVNALSILKLKHAKSEAVAVEANEHNEHLNTQSPLSLFYNTIRKRTQRLTDSKKKKKKIRE